jgi:hypothetical protein
MRCAKHPQEETYVRCGKCDTPICGRCTVVTPVGMKCRACAGRAVSVDEPTGRQMGVALAASLGAGLALGWISLFFFVLGGAIFGYLVGEVTLRAGSRRRGTAMQVIAGAGALLGGLLWHLPGFAQGHFDPIGGIAAVVTQPLRLVAIGLGIFFAVVHVRNI